MDWTTTAKQSAKKNTAKSADLPDWLSVADSANYNNSNFIKVSTNKGGANNLEGSKVLSVIPQNVFDELSKHDISNQNAIAALLVFGLNELKKQNKTLVLDFSNYGKSRKPRTKKDKE